MTESSHDEAAFLRTYDPRAYDPVAVTVDVVALTIRGGVLSVLLARRGSPPHAGKLALPGTFLRPIPGAAGKEWPTLEAAATAALRDKAGIAGLYLEQLRTYGGPGRDPRMQVVSVAYLAFGPSMPDPAAPGVAWYPADTTEPLAFDHAAILADGVERARSKLEYTTLAARFVGDRFTISELRGVYEAVWGARLDAANFYRKVRKTGGFVEATLAIHRPGVPGPAATYYRAGTATNLVPPITRKGERS